MYTITNLIMVLKVALYIMSILCITALVSAIIVNYAEKHNKSIL